MFSRFGTDAIDVIVKSRDAAGRWQHCYIGTEHLLIGLTADGNEATHELFEALTVDRERLRLDAEALLSAGDDGSSGPWALTPRTFKVVQLARKEAWRTGADNISPEHLLLGMLRDDGGRATGVLTDAGLTLSSARDVVSALLRQRGIKEPRRLHNLNWIGYRRWLRQSEPTDTAVDLTDG